MARKVLAFGMVTTGVTRSFWETETALFRKNFESVNSIGTWANPIPDFV